MKKTAPLKTALVTGATSGLGRALTRHLALCGFDLIAHGRSEVRLELLASELRGLGAGVQTVSADITEPHEIALLARRVAEGRSTLDLVVNNAAIGGGTDPSRREVNSGGHELRMVGNYLGPHQLNRALAPLLRAAEHARIINVVSIGQAPIDLTDIGFLRDYEGVEAYCRSKLALIMDTIDLAAELQASGVTVNAVHPAHLMNTAMVRDSGFVSATTVEEGMLAVLRLAIDSTLTTTTGRYFERFEATDPHPQANDAAVRAALQELATRALGGLVAQ